MSLLEVSNLEVKLSGLPIVKDISLSVSKGQIVTVLGANGVGKTTLMRTLSGIYRASQGHITFAGKDLTTLPAHEIVRLGLAQAPEGRQIFSGMTVDENLRLGAVQQKGNLAELDNILAIFPLLKERFRQKAGSLSGGEQQMLCIARALMSRPQLLLLDEPSLGLAPKLTRQIFDLIQAIRDYGTSILLVEQNARAALAIADFAYVIEGGRVTLAGNASVLSDDERIRQAYLGEQTSHQTAIAV
jgi:ABC-type branched-chain amino acid transport systems, ATPase component